MSDTNNRLNLRLPAPSEVAAWLPAEAMKYDPANPPLPGSVQRSLVEASRRP